jgi:perosamine synthetase
MLQPAELTLAEMGELAAIIPAADPEVKMRYRPIPDFDAFVDHQSARRIIPVCEPTLGGNELKYVTQAIEANWISSAGSFIRDFEARFAEASGTKYGIACANGTVAMHLAMATLGLEPGDEVIIPTFTMIATANAVTYCGAKPVLVDMEPNYWQMDIDQVAAKITPRTKAIVPVHIYGHPTDMDPLMALAQKHGLLVIEGAALWQLG